MRRTKTVLAVIAVMMAAMLVVLAAPAIADDFGRDCFPFCDNDRHDDDHDGDDDGDEDVDVDVEGPFLVGDEACVFVVTEEEEGNGDEDVDVDEECVNLF